MAHPASLARGHQQGRGRHQAEGGAAAVEGGEGGRGGHADHGRGQQHRPPQHGRPEQDGAEDAELDAEPGSAGRGWRPLPRRRRPPPAPGPARPATNRFIARRPGAVGPATAARARPRARRPRATARSGCRRRRGPGGVAPAPGATGRAWPPRTGPRLAHRGQLGGHIDLDGRHLQAPMAEVDEGHDHAAVVQRRERRPPKAPGGHGDGGQVAHRALAPRSTPPASASSRSHDGVAGPAPRHPVRSRPGSRRTSRRRPGRGPRGGPWPAATPPAPRGTRAAAWPVAVVGERVDHQHEVGRALGVALVDPEAVAAGAHRPVDGAEAVARRRTGGPRRTRAPSPRTGGPGGCRRRPAARPAAAARGSTAGRAAPARSTDGADHALPPHEAERPVRPHPHRAEGDQRPTPAGGPGAGARPAPPWYRSTPSAPWSGSSTVTAPAARHQHLDQARRAAPS